MFQGLQRTWQTKETHEDTLTGDQTETQTGSDPGQDRPQLPRGGVPVKTGRVPVKGWGVPAKQRV